MVISGQRIQTLTSLLGNKEHSQTHPENLKWPPVILGLGGASLEPGGRDRDNPEGL